MATSLATSRLARHHARPLLLALALALVAPLARAQAPLWPPWPPPGCVADVSQPAAFFCQGQQLQLASCNCSAQSQHFWTADSGGEMRHDTIVTPAFGDTVQAFYGNNLGWKSALATQANVVTGGASNHPDSAWWERDRRSGDTNDVTIITNVNTTGVNISAINVTEIEGCRQWATENGDLVAGAYLVGAPCVAGAANRAFGFDRAGLTGCIAALSDETNSSSLSGLCVAVENFRAATPYVVDDGAGFAHNYDGVGVTGGEGSARLLLDYAPAVQGEILDYLFKPGFALQADILKLEIGCDGNVVQGSTPSHQRSQGEAPNAGRGSQAWLAQQARARNPAIKLYALPWCWPGWLRSGQSASALTDPAAAAAYVVSWLQGMQALGVAVDVVGVESDKWDPVLSPAYVLVLKQALAGAGLSSVPQLACDDASGGWPCADQATNSASPNFVPALLDAVDIFTGHGDPSEAVRKALAGVKPLWQTHVSDQGRSDLLGATMLSWEVSELALNYNCTGSIVWGALCATYDGMPEYNQGLVRADSPWSGAYYVTPALWAVAHTSAFSRPGWRQLLQNSGSGVLAGSGSYVTRQAADSSAFSIVISKGANHDYARTANLHPEVVTFALRGAPLTAAQVAGAAVGAPQGLVYVYVSSFGGSPSSGNASFVRYAGNSSLYQINGAGDWVFTVFSGLDTITTVTTVANAFSRPVTTPAAPAAFPRKFEADWTAAAASGAGQQAPFVVDITGAHELVASPPAPGLQQVAPLVPLTRFQTDAAPHAVLGDEEWADVDVSLRAWLPGAADGALLGVRCSGFGDGANNHISGMDQLPGLWLAVNASGAWELKTRLDAGAATVAAGSLPVAPAAQQWHTLRLVVRASRLVASFDGTLLAAANVSAVAAPKSGFVAFGAPAFGQQPIFGGIVVNAELSTCSAAPQEGHLLVEEACSPGAAGQSWQLVPSGSAPGVGQLVSAANASLCIAANGTADAGFMGDANARGVFVMLCDANEPRQIFSVEGTIADGSLLMGPIQSLDRLTLNIKNDDDTSNQAICAYTWQGNSNAIWTLQQQGGGGGGDGSALIYNPLYATCITACDPQT